MTLSNKLFDMQTEKRIMLVIQIVGVSIALTAGFAGYRWYQVQREQQAQRRFSDCVKEYTNTATAQSGHQNWNMIVGLFELGAQEYAGTVLEPFYLAYQAEALLKENKLVEAAPIMDRAVSLLARDRDNDFYYLYALKNALLHIDLAETTGATTENIEKALVVLAEDKNNKQQDAALFYLGRYYLAKGNTIRAHELLQELASMPARNKYEKSPWAQEAERMLKQVNV